MAGGVAVGSAVGHVAGNAITGMMGGGGGQQQPDQYQQPPAPQQYQAPGQAGQGAEQGPMRLGDQELHPVRSDPVR